MKKDVRWSGSSSSRCRDFHAELEKERKAGKLTFAELAENEEDLAKLEAWFGKVHARDRFGAPLAEEAERAMKACREDLESFAESVYEAADHGWAGGHLRSVIRRYGR